MNENLQPLRANQSSNLSFAILLNSHFWRFIQKRKNWFVTIFTSCVSHEWFEKSCFVPRTFVCIIACCLPQEMWGKKQLNVPFFWQLAPGLTWSQVNQIPACILLSNQNRQTTYCVQVTMGSGNPSASQANKAELPMSAVALTSNCLARMVGSTETAKRNISSTLYSTSARLKHWLQCYNQSF